DIDDRRTILELRHGGEHVDAGAGGQVMVEPDHVDAAVTQPRQSLFAGVGAVDDIATPLQRLLHEAAEAWIVIDIENVRRAVRHFTRIREPGSPRRTGRADGWRWRSH